MDKRNILFIGGDERQIYCAKFLYDCGYEISVFGFENYSEMPEELMVFHNPKIAVILADVIVLPTPFAKDATIYAPYSVQKINPYDILRYAEKEKLVFGGKFDESFLKMLQQKQMRYFDFLKDEALTVKNAYLTAEGTVSYLSTLAPKSLFETKALIIGFGRIAKCLVRLMAAFKMNITVAARKKSDLTKAKFLGCKSIPIKQVKSLEGYDYVINTVPAKVFKNALIEQMSAPYIDLAGEAIEAKNYVRLSAVPGKYAPLSAGEYYGEYIKSILSEVAYE